MAGSSNLVPQPHGLPPNDWNQNPSTPHHPMFTSTNLEIPNSYEGDLLNSCIYYSAKDDVIYVPYFIPPNSTLVNKLLQSALDEGHIEQSLSGVRTILPQLMRLSIDKKDGNGRGQNDPMQHLNTSQYRGVIKCNEKRFEAFVTDNNFGGWKGKTLYIGGYETEIEAAKAHDLVSLKLMGSNSCTNFPVRCYWNETQEMQKISKSEYIQTIRRRGNGFSRGDTDYRGVYRSVVGSQQWQAWLGRDKGVPGIFLGSYGSEQDAARDYDIAVIRFKGVEAITNFALNSYDVRSIMKLNNPAVITIPALTITTPQTTIVDPQQAAYPPYNAVNQLAAENIASTSSNTSLHQQLFMTQQTNWPSSSPSSSSSYYEGSTSTSASASSHSQLIRSPYRSSPAGSHSPQAPIHQNQNSFSRLPPDFGTQILGGDMSCYRPFNSAGASTSQLVPSSAAANNNTGVASLVMPRNDQGLVAAALHPPLQQTQEPTHPNDTVVQSNTNQNNLNSIEDDFDILQFLDDDFMEECFNS